VSERARSEKVKLIRASVANLDYFFSNLKDAAWLPFLLEEGFFQNPIPPETGTTEDGQAWFRFPNWPESRYLARIAAEAPELVVEAIERIPNTANPRVHEDVIVAATALPGELAARVARREQRWLANYEGHLVSLPRPAGELLAHLAREGEVDDAFALSGTLLRIVVDPRYENQTSHHRAVALVGDWEYGEILETAWPSMITRSAFLPGVMEPVRSAIPATLAPSRVAQRRTWRTVMRSGVATSPSRSAPTSGSRRTRLRSCLGRPARSP